MERSLNAVNEESNVVFTKPIIDLIKEIRRHVPSEIKPAIKLANPEVMDEIISLYLSSDDTVLRALVKELCFLAGPEWVGALEPPIQDEKKYITKVYRGQTELVQLEEADDTQAAKQTAVRIYRGVVMS